MDIIEPEWDRDHRYAVALKIEGGGVCPLHSYEKLEQLREGYQQQLKFAVQKGLTKPIPIEFVDKTGKCKILTDMIFEFNLPRN